MRHELRTRHCTSLAVSAAHIQPGCSITLSWAVIGVEANVASVHLTSRIEHCLCMIESVQSHSLREVIFKHSGTFSFTLTATLGDGVKRI